MSSRPVRLRVAIIAAPFSFLQRPFRPGSYCVSICEYVLVEEFGFPDMVRLTRDTQPKTLNEDFTKANQLLQLENNDAVVP
jgi:hypothetical protein